jgi:probable HAF family extracellular repeat protein
MPASRHSYAAAPATPALRPVRSRFLVRPQLLTRRYPLPVGRDIPQLPTPQIAVMAEVRSSIQGGITMHRHLLPALLSLSVLLSALAAAQSPSYTFTTLAVPGAISTFPFGINTHGQIVGIYYTDAYHGFLYDTGVFTPIEVPGAVQTLPYGINDQGQIVGSYKDPSDKSHGFLYDNAMFTSFDVPAALHTYPYGINNHGQIVGLYADSQGVGEGFLYADGVFTSLNVPGSVYTVASGINDQGQIVGTYNPNQGVVYGYLYTNGIFTTLTAAGSIQTQAQGINNHGQIVGWYTNSSSHGGGFLYTDGVLMPFDVPSAISTQCNGINDQGQIVGSYFTQPLPILGFIATPEVLIVVIDIQPGSDPASINPKSNGKIPVAILTTDTFDATTVNAATVRFGKTGKEALPVQVAVEDVNGDGRPDLLLTFNIQATGITCGATSASLTGETQSRQAITGTDAIQTVGCK